MKYIVSLAFMALLFSCQSPKQDTATSAPAADSAQPAASDTTAPPAPPAATTKEIKTNSGKVILVEETHPRGASLSDIKVSFAGDSASAFTLTDKDPVTKVLSGDLNVDGYDEVYIITTAAGSGSYGNVHGFASLKDRSLGMINFPEAAEKDLAKGGHLEGYEGHDEFEIVENSLSRRFPIKLGKYTMRSVMYKLVPGEAMFQLKVVNSTPF